jgi:hypothetical protein
MEYMLARQQSSLVANNHFTEANRARTVITQSHDMILGNYCEWQIRNGFIRSTLDTRKTHY